MTTQIKQLLINLKTKPKTAKRVGFFEVAQKNIIKSKGRKKHNFSEKIDTILYGK